MSLHELHAPCSAESPVSLVGALVVLLVLQQLGEVTDLYLLHAVASKVHVIVRGGISCPLANCNQNTTDF